MLAAKIAVWDPSPSERSLPAEGDLALGDRHPYAGQLSDPVAEDVENRPRPLETLEEVVDIHGENARPPNGLEMSRPPAQAILA
jgi:hypothetical protein